MQNHNRFPAVIRILLLICCASLLTLSVAQNARSAAGQSIDLSMLSNADCIPYVSSTGATHVICVPTPWYGSLIVYAHGYVSPDEPPLSPPFPAETARVKAIAFQLGLAFATTSYPTPGLVLSPDKSALPDLEQLVDEFISSKGLPRRTYLVGASEGGLVATKAVESLPDVFSGGLAVCGPVGDFRKQIDYFGDFFVVFNYFFPEVFKGQADPGGVPKPAIDGWDTLAGKLPALLATSPDRTRQLLKVTKAAIDPADITSVAQTVTGLLWYDVFATDDAIQKLGGQPFDNRWRWYSGSSNDWLLNRGVKRFTADPNALRNIDLYYQTTGRLKRPLVTMHTTSDPIVPYWHEDLYWWKALLNGSVLLHTNIPVARYGHCNFTDTELVTGFALLVLRVTGQNLFAQ